MGKLRNVAITVALAAAAVGVAASPANAGITGMEIWGAQSHLFMEVRGSSTTSGMTIDQAKANRTVLSSTITGENQHWSLPSTGDGATVDGATGYIQNMYSQQCIETDGLVGDAVYQEPCNGSALQQWHFTTFRIWNWSLLDYDYWTHIVNPATNLALDVRGGSTSSGGAIIGWPLSGQNAADNQSWALAKTYGN